LTPSVWSSSTVERRRGDQRGKDQHDPHARALSPWATLGCQVAYGHWKTLTFVAALRCDGIVAPCVLRQPVNAISFLAWVTQFLVPTLRPGDVVIMDNLSSHKRQAIRAAIRAAGALLLFLPAYSPDLNPIEQVFAKIKGLLRKADARSIDDINAALAALLNQFEPDECARYISAAGYRSTSA
jgi:transposase